MGKSEHSIILKSDITKTKGFHLSSYALSLNKKAICWIFAGYVVFVTTTLLASWWMLLEYSAHIIEKVSLLVLVFPVLGCALLFVVLIARWRLEPGKIFILLALPMLLFFALFILPDQVPDEIWYIYRIFDLRVGTGDMVLPSALDRTLETFPTNYATLHSSLVAPYDWSDTFNVYRDLRQYLLHLFIIPSLVVDFCELLNINPIACIFIARITNGALFLIAGYWILRHIPIGKTLTCIFLLNPMLLQQEASCSVDVIVNIVSLMFVSYVVELRFQKSRIRIKQMILLAVLLVVLCFSKYVYSLLTFSLLLLVPRLECKRTRAIIYLSTAGVVFVACICVIAFYDGANYHETFVLIRNPPDLVRVMAKSFYEVGPLWVKETFGGILGALNIPVWEPCFWAYCLVLLFAAVFNLGEERGFVRVEKIFLCALALFSIIGTILIFREWTLTVDHRSDIIMGVQGRYFIPFVFLPLLSAVSPRSSLFRKNSLIFFAGVLIVIALLDGLVIIRFFI